MSPNPASVILFTAVLRSPILAAFVSVKPDAVSKVPPSKPLATLTTLLPPLSKPFAVTFTVLFSPVTVVLVTVVPVEEIVVTLLPSFTVVLPAVTVVTFVPSVIVLPVLFITLVLPSAVVVVTELRPCKSFASFTFNVFVVASATTPILPSDNLEGSVTPPLIFVCLPNGVTKAVPASPP